MPKLNEKFNEKYHEEEFHPYARESVTHRRIRDGHLEFVNTLRFNCQDTFSDLTDAELIEYSDLCAKADFTGLAEDKIAAFDYINNINKRYWKEIERVTREERAGHVF